MARILVVFSSGKVGCIHESTLGYQIKQYEVIAFLRSAGWVLIGTDPIRSIKQHMARLGKRRDDFIPQRTEQ